MKAPLRTLPALTALVAAGALAAPAQALTDNVRTLEASVSPNRAGASAKVSLRLLTRTRSGLAPDAGAADQISLPRGLAYNGSAVPSCRAEVLVAGGPSACPRGSVVGGGSITGLIRNGCGNPPMSQLTGALVQTIDLTIVNARRGKALLAYLKNPVIGATYISIGIGRAPAPFGLKFAFTVPDLLLQPVDGVCTSLVDVKINIARRTVTERRRVGGRTVTVRKGLVQTGKCPSTRKWPFRDAVMFASGADRPGTQVVDRTPTQRTAGATSVACRP
jgi:hypothetical protein